MSFFNWNDKAIEVLKTRYRTDGPVKLAKELGTSLASVVAKARKLGIEPARRNAPPIEWTDEMLAKMHELYATADAETLVREIGVPLYAIRTKGRKLGLRSETREIRRGHTHSLRNKSCDIHYFDQWSPSMAYILGFLFADGNVTSRLRDVIVAVAARDVAILDFIKKELKSTRPYYYRSGGTGSDGCNRQESVMFTAASTIMVRRLMALGLKPRKSYTDEPFPEVPKEHMPHFIRGYFDGDGSVYIARQDGTCRVSFVGSPRFITGIRDSLEQLAGMRSATVVITKPGKTEHGRIIWAARRDLCKFRDYIYPPDMPFCLERKHRKLVDWLNDPANDNFVQPWTEEDIQTVRDLYRVVGAEILASRLGRSHRSVYGKARDLGLT